MMHQSPDDLQESLSAMCLSYDVSAALLLSYAVRHSHKHWDKSDYFS